MSDEDDLDGSDPTPGSLAYKLTELRKKCVNPSTGRPFSLPGIAEQINQQGDEMYASLPEEEDTRRKISRTYLWELMTGRKDNPTRLTLQSLATYFGVPVSYLTEDASTEAENAQYLTEPDLNLRARGLSRRGMENVARWIEHARALEGLDDPSAPANSSDSLSS